MSRKWILVPFAAICPAKPIAPSCRAQYERGALLVIPNTHIPSIMDLDDSMTLDLYREVGRIARALVPVMQATGVNILQNNGASSGQTVPHLHVHVIPRYPHSDPAQRFREGEFPQTPINELERLAMPIREAITGAR
jgi:diadenosine tetraphosphate (Ap4A) HIT family hydrolase